MSIFEDLGAFAPVLASAGYEIEYFDVGVDDFCTHAGASADLLLVLAGPIGRYETALYPFLLDEVEGSSGFPRSPRQAKRPRSGLDHR
jgi:GMP synthase (glutamine-hydrolysing)